MSALGVYQDQIVTAGRDALSRATRQVVQALLPTLLIIAGGSVSGINVRAVAVLAGVTAAVSLLKSAAGFRFPADADPLWHLIERAITGGAGTALGFLTIDGTIPAASIDFSTTLTATSGAALLAMVMFYLQPPAVVADPVIVESD